MRKNLIHSIICILLLFYSFSSLQAQIVSTQKDLAGYLDSKEKRYEEICIKFGTQTWNMYSGEAASDMTAAKLEFAVFYNDDNLKKIVTEWNARLKDSPDKILKRRVQIWKNILDASVVEYDPEIVKTSAKLLEEVRNRDPKNEDQTKDLEKRVLELIKLRNAKVQKLGYKNYPEFVFEHSDAGYKWFNQLVDMLEKRTGAAYGELYKKIKTEKGQVGLMDIAEYQSRQTDPQFSKDSLLIVMKETTGNIGIDYDKLPIRFVVKEADFGGNCIGLDIPNDFRVIMVPNMPISVYLHELGHGLQWIKTSINTPILEGYEWCLGNGNPSFYEGMAETLAKFCKQTPWYKKYSRFTNEEIEANTKQSTFVSAVTIRMNLAWFMSEIELYNNPAKDINEIVKDLYKKYFWVENVNMPTSLANTMYVDYPCYKQNYLLADIISWQVHGALRNKFGADYVFNKNVGQFLTDNLYKDGMLKNWQSILKDATGKELDVDGYLKSLGL